MQYIFTNSDKQYIVEASEMKMTDMGYAFLFDQEGDVCAIIRDWEFVTMHEPAPKVRPNNAQHS